MIHLFQDIFQTVMAQFSDQLFLSKSASQKEKSNIKK